MKKRLFTALIISLTFSVNLFAFQSEENKEGFNSVKQKDLKMHLRFLASDELEGREMCEPGSRITAVYIASRFARLGLKPAGENNSYMQNFKVRRRGVDPDAASFSLHYGTDKVENFDLGNDFLIERGNVREPLPVVFVGYGLDLEEYNDYENVDVQNKIVLYFSHTPQEGRMDGKFSDPRYLQDYELYKSGRRTRLTYKNKENSAKEKGAAGIIIVENPNHSHEKSYSTLKERMTKQVYRQRNFSLDLRERESRIRLPKVYISEQTAQKIFRSAGKSLYDIQGEFDKTAQPNSFEIKGVTIGFTSSGEKSVKNTRNVVGLLEGSDPVLKNEAIVIGGHYDHVHYYLDFMTGTYTDEICNGADDDASGTVGVIELAEAFVENDIKTKRSIIFIAFTGEEKGLIGSTYYADNPVIPIEKTAAMIQFDMIGRNEDIKNSLPLLRGAFGFTKEPFETAEDNKNAVNILGTTFCNEMRVITEKLNENINLELKFRYDDKQNLIRASDHAPFLRKDVPVAFFSTGLHPDLHAPGDDVEKINFPKMERILKLAYLTVWELANRNDRLSLDKPFK